MHEPPLVESIPSVLELTEAEAAALRAVGRRLVSTKPYYKEIGDEPQDEEENEGSEKSVIRCTHLDQNRYRVVVSENIGVIAIGARHFVVEPKIGNEHFRYLLYRSGYFPRMSEEEASLKSDSSLWDLIAHWFMVALETLMRKGLLADYHEEHDRLALARGTVRPLETAMLYYRGDLSFSCDYEEFGPDSPLNRMLKGAALVVAQAPVLNDLLRQRARRSLSRLDDVGAMRPGDLRVATDRHTVDYRDSILLARHVLSATGRTTEAGTEKAWTFLVRTPELIERGVRQVLADGLAGMIKVRKRGRQIEGSKHILNPDLVFGTNAVGDVKYKLPREWSRPDLYQITAFATGFGVWEGAVFAFKNDPAVELPSLKLGPVTLRAHLWDSSPAADPGKSAADLVTRAMVWLEEVATEHEAGPA